MITCTPTDNRTHGETRKVEQEPEASAEPQDFAEAVFGKTLREQFCHYSPPGTQMRALPDTLSV